MFQRVQKSASPLTASGLPGKGGPLPLDRGRFNHVLLSITNNSDKRNHNFENKIIDVLFLLIHS